MMTMNNNKDWLLNSTREENQCDSILIVDPEFKRMMESTWFPISMAKLDGTDYIVYIEDTITNDHYIGKAHFDIENDSWCADSFGVHKCPLDTPMYFSYLPDLPNFENTYVNF